MIEKHNKDQVKGRKRNLITNELVIDLLMVALMAIGIVLLALVL